MIMAYLCRNGHVVKMAIQTNPQYCPCCKRNAAKVRARASQKLRSLKEEPDDHDR